MEWRDLAAVWGAGLSTYLAVERYFIDRPYSYWKDYDEKDCIILVFRNPSKKHLQISSVCMLGLGEKPSISKPVGSVRSSLEEAVDQHKNMFRLYFPPERGVELKFNVPEGCCKLLVFWWHRHSMPIIRLPHFVFVRHKNISQIKRTVIDDNHYL